MVTAGDSLLTYELIGNRVRNHDTFGQGDAVGDLTQHHGQGGVKRLADGGEQLGGGLLLATLDLGEVPQGDTGLRGDLAQRASLVLSDARRTSPISRRRTTFSCFGVSTDTPYPAPGPWRIGIRLLMGEWCGVSRVVLV